MKMFVFQFTLSLIIKPFHYFFMFLLEFRAQDQVEEVSRRDRQIEG